MKNLFADFVMGLVSLALGCIIWRSYKNSVDKSYLYINIVVILIGCALMAISFHMYFLPSASLWQIMLPFFAGGFAGIGMANLDNERRRIFNEEQKT